MPSYSITNQPQNLTMNDVKAYSSALGGLAKSARYAINILPVGDLLVGLGYADFIRHFTYLSDSTELPGRAFVNVDNRYYGPNFKLPFQSQYEDLQITFLCRTESFERQFFDDWMEIINPTNLWDFNYRDSYRSTIELFQLAEFNDENGNRAPKAVYKWTFWDAFPVIVNPQPVTWADDNIQRLSVSFTYTKWNRVGRDATAGSFMNDFIKDSGVTGLPISTVPSSSSGLRNASTPAPSSGSGLSTSSSGAGGGSGGGRF